jgi:hypothetical protein
MKTKVYKYPNEEPIEEIETILPQCQKLRISADPASKDLPWGIVTEDETIYCVSDILIHSYSYTRCDWTADNYWNPKMWIETYGVLTIDGSVATIFE